MTLVDPTSGAGYAPRAPLPSTHMTTIATQQPNALDVVGGGTYSALGANIAISASSSRTLTFGNNVALNCTEPATLAGGCVIADDSELGANTTMTVRGVLAEDGAGRVRHRVYNHAADANFSVGPEDATLINLPSGVIGTARTLTIDDTGAAEGDWLLIATQEVTSNLVVADSGVGTIATLKLASGSAHGALVYYIGGVWTVVTFWATP